MQACKQIAQVTACFTPERKGERERKGEQTMFNVP